MTLDIRQITVSDLAQAPNIQALLEEYAVESSIKGMPHPDAKVATYRALEATGAFTVIGAYLGGELIGFINILSSVIPHYGVLIGVSESFFVTKQHRNTGAGLKLLAEAEARSKGRDCQGMLITAPTGSTLAEVLPNRNYRETNRVFFKGLADA